MQCGRPNHGRARCKVSGGQMPLLRKAGKDLLLIHIPKCGGTSLEKLFSDNVEMSLFHSGPGELHCSPQHFHASLLEDLFDYRVPPAVTIVRNPFGRLVSEYRYQRQNGLSENIAFDQFVENSFGEYWKNSYVYDNHIRTQTQFITAETTIFRFEEAGVDAARKYIDDYLGIPSGKKITKENVSRKLDFLIAPETLRLINSFYQRDFELLGYAQIQPGEKPKKLSSLSYSPQPASDLTPSKFIRQKVLHDKTLVVEGTVNRMTADLERAEKDRKSAEDAVSSIEKELQEQSLANSALASKLDQRLAGLEELFKGSVTSLLEEALSKQETSARKLQEAVKNSLENVGDELAGLHQIQSLATVVEELDKSVIRYRDEATNESTELATHLEKLVSERESSYRNILKNFTESYSVHNTEMTELLEDIQRESKSTGAFLESKLTRLDSYLGSNAKTFEAVQKNIGQVLTTVARGFDSQNSNQAGHTTELSNQFSELVRYLADITQSLDKTGSDVITAVKASRELVTDRLGGEYKFVTDELASLNSSLSDSSQPFETIQKTLAQTTETIARGFDKHYSLHASQGQELSASLARLAEKLAGLDQSLAGTKNDLLTAVSDSKDMVADCMNTQHDSWVAVLDSTEKIVQSTDKITEELTSNAAFQNALVLTSVDTLKQDLFGELAESAGTLQQKLERKLEQLVEKLEHLDKNQESKRLAFERDLLNQFTALNDTRRQELLEFQARSKELTSELDRAKSSERELKQVVAEMKRSEGELQASLQETLGRFETEIQFRDSLQARNKSLEEEVAKLTQRNRQLMESNSFRLTRPLRFLSTTLQTLRARGILTTPASSNVLRLAPPARPATDTGMIAAFSQLNIAIIVENLDRGGLEQVVLDHARYFNHHCRSLDLYVIYETGHVYEQALKYGINVLCVTKDDLDMEHCLLDKEYDYTFCHHSYGYLPAFRPATKTMVEVIHNEYSWQLDNSFFEKIRSENIDWFIAVSNPVRQYSIDKLAIDATRIVSIFNGLNIEGLVRPPVEVMQEYRRKTLKESPTFIMCANGQPQKNHVLVIRAFALLLKKYPKSKLLLPGNLAVNEDTQTEIFDELKKYGNPNNIELPGSLNRRELSKLLATSHIAMLPSKYEGFSISTLEYLYFGLPMILSDTGGSEYIAQKYGSVIVEKSIVSSPGGPSSSEVKALASAMSKMIREYTSYLEKSGKAAISHAEYSVESVCKDYLSTNITLKENT